MGDGPTLPNMDGDSSTVLEEAPPELRKPRMYQVVLLNDDYTPMEFVVELIEKFFNKSAKINSSSGLFIFCKMNVFDRDFKSGNSKLIFVNGQDLMSLLIFVLAFCKSFHASVTSAYEFILRKKFLDQNLLCHALK